MAQFTKLVILFVGLPLVELAILIKLGTLIGVVPTISIVFLTGILGAALARSQGIRVWIGIQNELQSGRIPAEGLLDGMLVLIGGVVLLTPGIITDMFGFFLLIPWSRLWLKRWLRKKFEQMMEKGETRMVFLIK